jgi:4-diphosphocytidyl-2-C-methyl-D-erythritol kinase
VFGIAAPAKLNLTLEVLGECPDGYHEIRSIVQTVNLSDTVLFGESKIIEFHSSNTAWSAKKSLVSKAVELVVRTTGCDKGAAIGVIKNIPFTAGLGGDSSDAASVLAGLNEFWDLKLSQKSLLEMAWKLGSDVPLFFLGGTLLVEGRGERVTPLPPFPTMWAVILAPPVPRDENKTAQLYAALKPSSYTQGEITEALAAIIAHDEAAELNMNEWGIGEERYVQHLFNVFEGVADEKFPGLAKYRDEFREAGATAVHLTGSGPALYSLFFNAADAAGVYSRLKAKGLECYMAGTRGTNR